MSPTIDRLLEMLTAAGRTPLRRSRARWWFAIAMSLIALAGVVLLMAATGERAPFHAYCLALIVVACYAGAAAGLLTLAIGAIGIPIAWSLQHAEKWIATPADAVGSLLFVLAGLGVIGVCAQLRLSRARNRDTVRMLRTVVDHAPGFVFLVDAQGRLRFASRRLADSTGRSPEELIGRPAAEMLPGMAVLFEDAHRVPGPNNTQRSFDVDWGERRARVSGFKVPVDFAGERMVGGYFVDATDAARAQAALEAERARLRFVQEHVGVGFWDLDLASGRLLASESAWRLHGCDPPTGEVPENVWIEAIHPDDRRSALDRLERAIARGESGFESTFRTQWPDGSIHWLDSRVRIERDARGIARRVTGVTMDVTETRRIQDEQTRSAAQLRLIADTLPVLVAYVDREHRYRFNSKAYETFFRCSASQLQGKLVREVIGERAYEVVQPALERAFAGETVRLRTRSNFPAIGAREVTIIYVPHVVDGAVQGVVALIEDVTDQAQTEQRLQESEERLRLAMDGARMGTWHCDYRAGHTIWDRRHAELLGYHPDRMPRVSDELWRERIHPEDRERARLALEAARRATGPFELELRIRRADNQESRWLALFGRYFRDARGEIVASTGIVFDVTARKEALLQLERHRAELQSIQQRLEQADRRKDEFLATLAHELRNPLAPIRYSVRLLRADAAEGAIDKARETIDRQASHMARLLDDLLDMSRVTRGAIELKCETLDLRRCIEEAVETVRPLSDAAGHRVSLSLPGEPMWISADRVRLAQIVGNLLQNAVKYTDACGLLEVCADVHEGRAVLRVKDNGIGLTEEMQQRVFDLFAQVHKGLTNSRSGLGIGLAIVKKLVELHGATISVRSAGLDQGSEFIVSWPLAQAPHESMPSNVVPLFGEARHRIIVADDNVDGADSLAALLRLSGYAVQVAYDGAGAVALARAEVPECMVLDLGMPQLSGYDVARWVRAQSWGRTVKLIALTGWGQESDRRRTHEAGFDAHLTKPVDPDLLLETLRADAATGFGRDASQA